MFKSEKNVSEQEIIKEDDSKEILNNDINLTDSNEKTHSDEALDNYSQVESDKDSDSNTIKNKGSLINCPDCGNLVSYRAVSCPQCGCPITQSEQNKMKKLESSKKRKKIPPTAIALIVTASLIIVSLISFSCVYFYNYKEAKEDAQNRNFISAYKHLIIPPLTRFHDKTLVDYISYGSWMQNEYYKEAALEFYKMPQYMESKDLAKECSILYANILYEKKDFDEELGWGQQLAEYDKDVSKAIVLEARYNIAEEKRIEVQAEEGFSAGIFELSDEFLDIYNEGFDPAYDSYVLCQMDEAGYLASSGLYKDSFNKLEPIKYYNQYTLDFYNEIVELTYLAAQTKYANGEFSIAYDLFNLTQSYKDSYYFSEACYNFNEAKNSSNYSFYLRKACDYIHTIPYVDTVIFKDYDLKDKFFIGKWKTIGGDYYFQMEEDGHIWYNIPWVQGDDEYYYFNNNVMRFGTKKCYTFEILSYDEINIYA